MAFPILYNDDRERKERLRREMIQMRIASNPLNSVPDTRFKEIFRLTKEMVTHLFNRIIPYMRHSGKRNSISPELRILACLTFYATGSYQRPCGQYYSLAMSQQSIGRAIDEVTRLLVTHLSGEWITFPTTRYEKERIAADFYRNNRFPGCIGAIDCTHVDVLAPHVEEHNYVDRRQRHSKNIQIVSTYTYLFM